jgi:hypothetical protein
MKPNWEAIDAAIVVLNRLLKVDPEACRAFFLLEAPVNTMELGDDPEIQCLQDDPPNGPIFLRPLGLINGLFGADERACGFITMDIEDTSGSIVGFRRAKASDWDILEKDPTKS